MNDWKEKYFNIGVDKAQETIDIYEKAYNDTKNSRYINLLRKEIEDGLKWFRQLKSAGKYAKHDKAYYESCGKASRFWKYQDSAAYNNLLKLV